MKVGETGGHQAVHFFGFRPHVAAFASFHVSERYAEFARSQGAGQGGVRVSSDYHHVGLLGRDDRLEALQHSAGLPAMGAGPDPEQVVGRRQPKLLEERLGHRMVVVLTGMYEHLGVTLSQHAADRPCLHELGTSPDDGQHFHRAPSDGRIVNVLEEGRAEDRTGVRPRLIRVLPLILIAAR